MPVTIKGVITGALIDSGASTSVLSKSIYMAMPKQTRYVMRPDDILIRGVGESVMAPLGRLNVDIGRADKLYPIEMVVSSADETVGCYLGIYFLTAYGCDCSLRDGTFTLDGKTTRLRKESPQDHCARNRL